MSAALPIDSKGKPIAVGSWAVIPELPHWLVQDLPTDEVKLLRQTEGSVMKVIDIDAYGYVWFGTDNQGHWFSLQPSEITLKSR